MAGITEAVDEQMARIRRGAADIVPEDELVKKIGRSLQTDRPLRVKLGLDPTAPDIHIGIAVVMHKLRAFQDMGHHAVLIIGDYTATVGDPSEQNALRPQLTHEQVMAHARTYLDQMGKIVDIDEAEVVRNGDWYGKMTFGEVIGLAARLTVARCIERDDFAKRLSEGRPVFLHELLYPLMQAYDSVMVRSDVEIGGTDQIFNMLVGRELQRQMGQEPQIVITNPLLEGLDGHQKMSKSKGNYIGISEPPEIIFGKAMSIPDELMEKYFVLATDVPADRVSVALSPGVHPREAKAELAAAIVERYYDAAAAEAAGREFDRVFKQHELPEDMPDITVGPDDLADGKIWIVKLLQLAGMAKSGGEARRLVAGGGVSIGMAADSLEVVDDTGADVAIADGAILKVGKSRFCRLLTD